VDLATETGLSPSTALRLLRTLEDAEFVKKTDDGKYDAGGRLLQLSLRAVAQVPLIDLTKPHLETLRHETGESAYLGLRGPNNTVLYASSAESHAELRHVSWPGRLIPIKGTAIGAALEGLVDERTGVAVSSRTIVDDATAIAAPIYGIDGEIVAAISVVGPTFRLKPSKIELIGPLILKATNDLSRYMNVRTPPL
jgi:IclR family acetate operon transcriptional repressor